MRFGKLIIHNFFRAKHVEINLGKPGLCLVEGRNFDCGSSNEAGKSTIFNALSWCLYGKWPGGPARPGDEIVNPTVKRDCFVEVEIITADDTARVRRARMEGEKHQDSKLYISYKGEAKEHNLRENDISASTKWIADFLGMDYQMFTKQRYFAQEDVQPITRMKQADLKKFCLENLLQIEWTQQALEKCRDDISKTKAFIAQAEARREGGLRQLISRHEPLLYQKKKMREWEGKEKERQIELAKELQEAAQLMGQAAKENKVIEKDIADAEKKYARQEKEFRKKLDKMDIPRDFGDEEDDLQRELRQITSKIGSLEATISQAEKRRDRLQEKIEGAESQIGEKCESCGTKITKKHLPFMTKELATEIETLESVILDEGETLAGLQNRSESILGDLKKVRELREGQRETIQARANIQIEIAQLQAAKSRQINTLRDDLIDIDMIRRELERITKEQERAKENPHIDMVVREKEEIKRIVTDMKEWKTKEVAYKDDLRIAQVWEKAFSSKIQAWLLNDITDIINRIIAGYMLDLADGRISARLHTVKRLKTGEYRENFGLEINNMDGGKSFISLSGGAKRRVDLAVSLAIADFQRALSDKQLDFLVMDEWNSALDSYWEEKFFQLVKKRFDKISCYVITHKETSLDMFDRVIRVTKRNGETRIEA